MLAKRTLKHWFEMLNEHDILSKIFVILKGIRRENYNASVSYS